MPCWGGLEMTEAEWLTSNDSQAMLSYLRTTGRATERKLMHFAVACCRGVWHLLTDDRSHKAVEVAERFADRDVTTSELNAAQLAVERVPAEVDPRWLAAWGVACDEALDA